MSVLYAEVLACVRARTGLLFPPSRLASAEAAVEAVMATLGMDDVAAYLERIRVDDAAFEELIAELTVGETYFCRDGDQFALLRSQIVPDIVDRHGEGHAIRAWSAGCASGEEAYTLAILFLEKRLRSRILATDISPRALIKARAASYGSWSLRGTQPDYRRQWFRKLGDRYVLDDAARQRVRFDVLNLASDAYPSRVTGTADLDLILCRNVLIYFDAETIREVGRRLMRALAPGGWLLLGASDPLLECIDGVQRILVDAGVVYHRRGTVRTLDAPTPYVEVEAGGEVPIWDPAPPCRAWLQPASPGEGGLKPRPTSERERELDVDTAIQQLRAAADAGRSAEVLHLASEMTGRFPLSAELHLLYALILMEVGSDDAAEAALRRALFLDRSLSVAHYALGALQKRRGNDAAAERSFRNATEDRT